MIQGKGSSLQKTPRKIWIYPPPFTCKIQNKVGLAEKGLNLDLNQSADPEVLDPESFRLCVERLNELLKTMRASDRKEILPDYNNKKPIYKDPYIQGAILDFLKQRNGDTLMADQAALGGLRKESPIFIDLKNYLLKLKDRGGGDIA